MEGFKSNPKMKSDIACFKEGGSVYKSRTHKEDPKEVSEDKAMVKKGIRQHETAKHKGEEKTEIKLKQGGRSKKDSGSVRKYKTGGLCNPMKTGGVTNVKKEGGAIEMKKGRDDKKSIANIKKAKPGKADAPSAASGKKKESPATGNRPAKKTMTASSVGSLPPAAPAESAAMSMPEDQPIEMMADGGMAGGINPLQGQGIASDYERQMMRRQMMRRGMQRPQPTMPSPIEPYGDGVMGGVMDAGMGGGMGAAAASGPMGNAAPRGMVTDEERNLLRGLQAVGRYAGGGSC